MTTITLIESQKLFRNSLMSLITSYTKCKIVQSAPTIEYFKGKTQLNKCDLVLLSIYNLSEENESTIKKTKAKFPSSKIVVISDGVSNNDFLKLVKLDIYALFSTNASSCELENLLSNYDKYNTSGGIKIDAATRDYLRSKHSKTTQGFISFTPRELEVLNLVCQEQTNVEISQTLGLSIRTIESFRRKMILKAGCKNMIGVVIRALELTEFRLSH